MRAAIGQKFAARAAVFCDLPIISAGLLPCLKPFCTVLSACNPQDFD